MDTKYALVTGGSRGIGRSTCLKLSEMGFYILINYRSNHEEAQSTLNSIVNRGGAGELMQFDISSKEQTEKALEAWLEKNEGCYIEVLVNNAGIRKDNLMWWMKDEEWNDVIDTNLNGYFYVTRYLLKDMMYRKYGRIINVVSLSGQKGLAGQTNYSAAKAAVIGLTKSLAQEVGKKKVTVNAVSPGFIKTDMTKDLNEKEFKSMIPLNRFGDPEEVSELIGFLASDKSSYITGETISINGGLYT